MNATFRDKRENYFGLPPIGTTNQKPSLWILNTEVHDNILVGVIIHTVHNSAN